MQRFNHLFQKVENVFEWRKGFLVYEDKKINHLLKNYLYFIIKNLHLNQLLV